MRHGTRSTRRRSRASANRIHAALGARAGRQAATGGAGVALTGGAGWFKTVRHIDVPVPATTAKGLQDFAFGTISLRAGKRYDFDGGYIKPGVELVGSPIDMDAFHEAGAGPLNISAAAPLNISAAATSLSYVRIKPGIEFGTDLLNENGVWFRPSLRLGVNGLLSGDNWVLSAGFDGAPAGIGAFRIGTRSDSVRANSTPASNWWTDRASAPSPIISASSARPRGSKGSA